MVLKSYLIVKNTHFANESSTYKNLLIEMLLLNEKQLFIRNIIKGHAKLISRTFSN